MEKNKNKKTEVGKSWAKMVALFFVIAIVVRLAFILTANPIDVDALAAILFGGLIWTAIASSIAFGLGYLFTSKDKD